MAKKKSGVGIAGLQRQNAAKKKKLKDLNDKEREAAKARKLKMSNAKLDRQIATKMKKVKVRGKKR